jgi:hypothetical protein
MKKTSGVCIEGEKCFCKGPCVNKELGRTVTEEEYNHAFPPKKEQIVVGENEAAIIFKDEFMPTVYMPSQKDEDTVPTYAVLALAITLRCSDDAWVAELMEWFDKRMKEGNNDRT